MIISIISMTSLDCKQLIVWVLKIVTPIGIDSREPWILLRRIILTYRGCFVSFINSPDDNLIVKLTD